jgi:heptosyltransferase I
MLKILIIKTSALGDIVQLFPAIQFIKEIDAKASIDWVVEKGSASLVQAHPHVNKAIVIETKQWRQDFFSFSTWKRMRFALNQLREEIYDVVFDFQGNTKSGMITGLVRAKVKVGFGKKNVSEKPNLLFTNLKVDPPSGRNIRYDYLALIGKWSGKTRGNLRRTLLHLSEAERSQLRSLIQQKSRKRNIMICPGSNWRNKQLPDALLQPFLLRVESLVDCKFWLVYGTPEEKKCVEALRPILKEAKIVDKLSLPLLQHWMREMDHVIAMDSLPLHLAAESGVATFSIFGASSAIKYRPLGDNHSVYQGSCPYGQTFVKRCPILRTCETGACVNKLPLEELILAYTQFIQKI